MEYKVPGLWKNDPAKVASARVSPPVQFDACAFVCSDVVHVFATGAKTCACGKAVLV